MIGLGTNPNVYGALVVSLETVAGRRVMEGISARTPRYALMGIQEEGGTPRLFEKAVALLGEWKREVDALTRSSVALSELVIGLECGGSDTTSGLVANPAIGLLTDRVIDEGGTAIFSEPVECLGGEAVLTARTPDAGVQEQIRATVRKYEEIALRAGVDLNKTNPAPDNIRGGLTTIEEKSLGSISKAGTRTIRGVLDYGEAPRSPGLYLMDAPAPATENMTALGAGGTHLILFGTGVGNSIGCSVSPTVKICGNPLTCDTFAAHIDVDLSNVITEGLPISAAGDAVMHALSAVVNGELTRCEVLGETEIAISRIGESV
jgi:altronate dehydratase large subunit